MRSGKTLSAPLEKIIQRQILEWLRYKKVFCWKQNNVGIRKPDGGFIPASTVGVPDILGIVKGGKFLGIEVKRSGGKPSPAQTDFLENIKRNGGIAIVATSLEEVINAFEINDIR